jgi:taurine dioxygenase
VHRVVIRHPETGRKALYVNRNFTLGFEGWTREESDALLAFLYEHGQLPEFTCRFRWQPGSVAFWDNRAAVHLAPKGDEHLVGDRRLYRVTLVGDVPVGPDGRPSVALDGEPFEAL